MCFINIKTVCAPGDLSSGRTSKPNSILKSSDFTVNLIFHSTNCSFNFTKMLCWFISIYRHNRHTSLSLSNIINWPVRSCLTQTDTYWPVGSHGFIIFILSGQPEATDLVFGCTLFFGEINKIITLGIFLYCLKWKCNTAFFFMLLAAVFNLLAVLSQRLFSPNNCSKKVYIET